MRNNRSTRLRKVSAALSAVLYLWSILFVAFAHDHGLPSGADVRQSATVSASVHLASAKHRAPAGQTDHCIACIWEHCAGTAIVSVPVLPSFVPPAIQTAFRTTPTAVHPRAGVFPARAPPAA